MNKEIQSLVQRYVSALRTAHVPVQRVFVYGSAARGTMHAWSDIDVGVVGPSFAEYRVDEMIRLQFIAARVDPIISPIPLRPQDLEDRFDTIGDAIRKGGKEVPLD